MINYTYHKFLELLTELKQGRRPSYSWLMRLKPRADILIFNEVKLLNLFLNKRPLTFHEVNQNGELVSVFISHG